MQLLIFRHGLAEDQSADGSDAARALTSDGVRKTRRAARGLIRIIDRPDVILTSPLLRARQTAEILGLALKRQAEPMPELAEPSPGAIWAKLRERRERCVLLVGHEPTLSRLVQLLCAGRSGHDFIELKKAGCACLGIADPAARTPRAVLQWLATPKMMGRMA